MASLGKDLAAIRKKQNLSLDDIHEATKIPKHIITSIEDNSIFTEFDENITYIRSYVRSYAKALSIDEQQIVYALDKEELGSYSGSLLKSGANEFDEPFDFEEETEAEAKPETKDSADEKNEKDEPDEEEPADPEPEPSIPEPAPSPVPPNYSKNADSIDWANMGHRFQPLQTKSRMWIGVLIVLILAAGGLYFFLTNSAPTSTEESAADQTQTESQIDSLQLNIVPPVDSDSALQDNTVQNNQPVAINETLSDTLVIVVYAAYGKLEPVRVFTDIMDSVNPYWIEQGQAMRFDFVNTFRMRGEFDRIVLLMNGHVIEDPLAKFYDPDTRRIEIHRSFFEENEKWLQPAPDSLNIDAPPPSVILERPTFN